MEERKKKQLENQMLKGNTRKKPSLIGYQFMNRTVSIFSFWPKLVFVYEYDMTMMI